MRFPGKKIASQSVIDEQIPAGAFTAPVPVRKGRIRAAMLLTLLFFAAVGAKLIQYQIIEASAYSGKGKRQAFMTKEIIPRRGSILDRNGALIASTSKYVQISVDPVNAKKAAPKIAAVMGKIFNRAPATYLKKLKRGGRYVLLERQVDPERIAPWSLDTLPGVSITDEARRIYHTADYAGQLIGRTDIDDDGLAGVELRFNEDLSGVKGEAVYQLDGKSRRKPDVEHPGINPIPGHDVALTIDLFIQEAAEEELARGVKENGAEGGIVIVLHPATGEILAMAQSPRVGSDGFGKKPQQLRKLRAITDQLEPGSVFKIITAAAVLEHGLVSPERTFDGENGVYTPPGRKRRPIRDVHKFGMLTFREAMEQSSNIVMAKVSDIAGPERMYTTARDFGFGMKTGFELPGEVTGNLKNPSQWSGTTLNTISYGYEVGATPLQIAMAYAAIANGGVLMRPYVLKRITDAEGEVLEETEPREVRRVVSNSTAQLLTSLLEGAVERGTAESARIPGVRIAGKTGTAKHVVDGAYADKKYKSSFVGYFPADNPEIVCLVILDNPNVPNYYGGPVCGPIFREIARRIVSRSERLSSGAYASQDGQAGQTGQAGLAGVRTPQSLAASRRSEAVKVSASKPAASKSVAAKPTATKPAARKSAASGAVASIGHGGHGGHVVPDVRGYPMRKAVGLLHNGNFKPVVHGSGVVVSQSPGPGSPVQSGTVITLNCEPAPGGLR